MYYSLDRFEDNGIAVLLDDNGNKREVPLGELPGGIKQGDILTFVDDRFVVDSSETDRRREYVLRLQQSLTEE